MPAPTLGSVTEGMMGAQLDLQNIQLNQFKLQEAPIQLATEQINLQKEQIALRQQVKMLSLMQNLKPPSEAESPDGIATVLNQVAGMYLQSGMPDAAAKMAKEASSIQENASKIDARSYKMQNDRLSRFANILEGTPDTPGGYTAALQQMASSDPGVLRDKKFVSLMQTPWRPGMVKALERQALTLKEQAEVSYREKAGAHAAAAAEVDKFRVNLVKAQTKLAEDRDKALGKAGAPTVKASQLKAITDMAESEYPGADPADVRVRSRPLAEEMVKMMRDEGITESQAARRVYEQARSAGVFTGLRQAPVAKGTKPAAGLKLPQTAKQVQENQWYSGDQFPDGQPRVAMGGKFYTEEELAEAGLSDPNKSDDDYELGPEDEEDEDDTKEAQ